MNLTLQDRESAREMAAENVARNPGPLLPAADAPSIAGSEEDADAPSIAGSEEDADAPSIALQENIDSPRDLPHLGQAAPALRAATRRAHRKRTTYGQPVPPGLARVTSKSWPQPSSRTEYSVKVYSHLLKLSLRALNRANEVGKVDPLRAALPDWLSNYAYRNAEMYFWNSDDGPRSRRLRLKSITPEELDQQVAAALDRAFGVWDPTYMQRVKEMAAKGGRNSRPPGPKFTPDMLDGLDGLTAAQQAERLGCSTRTVQTLRASRKEDPNTD